ncbi:probable serine/threonine-protein kinase At1g54610 [Salvia miltiorrhiza]|uniref:probable serine/threonine-protein kinase At1g54610 n=1 Tax=Salvia miltiorrhiza TaxID=226208 RepID=UPI0025ABE65B|nr:probable serine/threonine-protein kinase At1g54610 [Salvia miltiorrhiza]XP_057771954.1 probable serine/threonine-protein kinase At1g54610 [Salvia miltiorrhiza]XP_057771955.1 probable serine/threonine-protein kinase At1g54610 [Salvia miltiorrhiza]
MGCVFGKEISSSERASGDVAGKGRSKGEERDSERREKVVVGSVNKSEGEAASGGDGGGQVPNGRDKKEERKEENARQPRGERRRSRPNPRLSNPPKNIHGEQVAAGWPSWLSAVAGEAINGWTPRRADSFVKIDKIGQGTYSNVYKAKDAITGKVVALKKVRFDNLEPESVRFMAREILILRRLDHPNVVKLQGLATSRMSCSLYLVFDYMEHDLAGLVSSPGIKFTEPQVKCYMNQLLSGLEHCHNRHVLHRDIKGSNLLITDGGVLKIADFGLASTFDPNSKQPMTSRVVTLWYRPPELLLGATHYGVGIDLWSAGCILAELFAGKPIMTGRTEVEQLHRIFKLCGSPSEEYWKKSKLPHATIFKPQQSYKRCIRETFKDFPPSALSLIDTLLAIDPSERQTATAALKSEFFTTKPYPCEPSSLPKYPPSKEMDAKRRDEEARRLRAAGKTQADGAKKPRTRERAMRGVPAPEANAELQANIDRRRLISHANAKSKSEKFPPPHQDGGLGYPLGSSQHLDPTYDPPDIPFSSTNFSYPKDPMQTWSGPLADPAAVGAPRRRSKPSKKDHRKDKNSGRNKERDDL